MKKTRESLRIATSLGLILVVLPILRFLPLPWVARIFLILAVAVAGLLPLLKPKKRIKAESGHRRNLPLVSSQRR